MTNAKYLIIALLMSVAVRAQWEPDFDNAVKKAKLENRLILLNFSGSDWCGPCILFKREFLTADAFIEYAGNNLVLVNADFPRKAKNQPSEEMTERNEKLAERYNKRGDFPYTLLLDEDGKILASWTGKPQKTVLEWIDEIRTHAKK